MEYQSLENVELPIRSANREQENSQSASQDISPPSTTPPSEVEQRVDVSEESIPRNPKMSALESLPNELILAIISNFELKSDLTNLSLVSKSLRALVRRPLYAKYQSPYKYWNYPYLRELNPACREPAILLEHLFDYPERREWIESLDFSLIPRVTINPKVESLEISTADTQDAVAEPPAPPRRRLHAVWKPVLKKLFRRRRAIDESGDSQTNADASASTEGPKPHQDSLKIPEEREETQSQRLGRRLQEHLPPVVPWIAKKILMGVMNGDLDSEYAALFLLLPRVKHLSIEILDWQNDPSPFQPDLIYSLLTFAKTLETLDTRPRFPHLTSLAIRFGGNYDKTHLMHGLQIYPLLGIPTLKALEIVHLDMSKTEDWLQCPARSSPIVELDVQRPRYSSPEAWHILIRRFKALRKFTLFARYLEDHQSHHAEIRDIVNSLSTHSETLTSMVLDGGFNEGSLEASNISLANFKHLVHFSTHFKPLWTASTLPLEAKIASQVMDVLAAFLPPSIQSIEIVRRIYATDDMVTRKLPSRNDWELAKRKSPFQNLRRVCVCALERNDDPRWPDPEYSWSRAGG